MKPGTGEDNKDWKTLYRAAILETDETTIPARIAVAEHALLTRGREIFYQDGCSEEKDALEGALHAIRAFSAARQTRHAPEWKDRAAPTTVASRVLPNWYGKNAVLRFPSMAER